MAKVRFKLSICGGSADENRVSAKKLASILNNVSQDVLEICKNIAHTDVRTEWKDKLDSCEINIVGNPKSGSFDIDCETKESALKWGEQSVQLYVKGLRELRRQASLPESNGLPEGFDLSILNRIQNYHEELKQVDSRLTISLVGKEAEAVSLDEKLRAAIDLRIASLETPPATEPEIHGYSVQGILFGIEDQSYDDPSAEMKVGVDPKDGTKWVCVIKKPLLPDNIDSYWSKEVVVTGLATFKARKHRMVVEDFRVLDGVSKEKAIEDFIKTNKKIWDGVDLESYMDFVRERD